MLRMLANTVMAKVLSTSSPVGWPKASLMRLNQSRSISAIEQGASGALGAGDLLVQHPHDAAAVERAGQFVEFGEFLDALVGFLELQAALVERLRIELEKIPRNMQRPMVRMNTSIVARRSR